MDQPIYTTVDRELSKLEKKSESSKAPLDLDDTRRLEILVRTRKMAFESKAPVREEADPQTDNASDEQLAKWASDG